MRNFARFSPFILFPLLLFILAACGGSTSTTCRTEYQRTVVFHLVDKNHGYTTDKTVVFTNKADQSDNNFVRDWTSPRTVFTKKEADMWGEQHISLGGDWNVGVDTLQADYNRANASIPYKGGQVYVTIVSVSPITQKCV